MPVRGHALFKLRAASCAAQGRLVGAGAPLGAFVIRLNLSRRWWAIWLLLLGLSAIMARHFDHGTPASWPAFAREATEIFLVPGGLVWMALFWHAFGSGPTEAGQVIIVLANATLWSLAAYTVSRISCWLMSNRFQRRSK